MHAPTAWRATAADVCRRYGPVLLLLCMAMVVLWPLADLEKWDEDEAGTVWQASDIVAGHVHRLGLVSSTGIRNMIGAALLAMPFVWLPDLLSISRALALMHLLALCPLALLIGRTPAEKAMALGVLCFTPALALSSVSMWNQYLVRLIGVLILALLIYLLERRGNARRRALAVIAYVGLALLQPAVHLVHFPDLAIHLFLLLVVLARYPAPLDRTVAVGGAILLALIAPQLYVPWIIDSAARLTPGAVEAVLAIGAVGFVAAAFIIAYGASRIIDRVLTVADSFVASGMLAVLLGAALPVVLLYAVHGTQIARRLAGAAAPIAVALLAVQLAMAIVLLPRPATCVHAARAAARGWDLLSRLYGSRAPTAALLLAYAALLVLGRLLLGLPPWARSDLWVSITPVFLVPPLMLAQAQGRLCHPTPSAALAVGLLLLGGLAAFGPGAAYRRTYSTIVPASEMRTAVDWVAARHRIEGGGPRIDLSYDLTAGKEWIPKTVTWHPDFRWYSIGRAYDWLLRRRHDLRNAHEGEVDRTSGGTFQLGFRGALHSSTEWEVIAQFDRLELRRRRNDKRQ